jgi:hypothetical protein
MDKELRGQNGSRTAYLTFKRRSEYNTTAYVIYTVKLIQTNVTRHVISSSLDATALREPWPPVLFASTGLYPELSFSILQSPSLVGPFERHLAI